MATETHALASEDMAYCLELAKERGWPMDWMMHPKPDQAYAGPRAPPNATSTLPIGQYDEFVEGVVNATYDEDVITAMYASSRDHKISVDLKKLKCLTKLRLVSKSFRQFVDAIPRMKIFIELSRVFYSSFDTHDEDGLLYFEHAINEPYMGNDRAKGPFDFLIDDKYNDDLLFNAFVRCGNTHIIKKFTESKYFNFYPTRKAAPGRNLIPSSVEHSIDKYVQAYLMMPRHHVAQGYHKMYLALVRLASDSAFSTPSHQGLRSAYMPAPNFKQLYIQRISFGTGL
jgi:hypothetical protein